MEENVYAFLISHKLLQNLDKVDKVVINYFFMDTLMHNYWLQISSSRKLNAKIHGPLASPSGCFSHMATKKIVLEMYVQSFLLGPRFKSSVLNLDSRVSWLQAFAMGKYILKTFGAMSCYKGKCRQAQPWSSLSLDVIACERKFL